MSEKKVYAMAPEGCAAYLTSGKVYAAEEDCEGGFDFVNDIGGDNYAKWHNSGHLDSRNWKRLELTEEEAEEINARLQKRPSDQLESHPNSELDADQYTVGGDTVNMPSHYTSGEIECIDAIQAQMTPEQYAGYLRGNCVKYIWRYQHKGGKESLLKAKWYLNRLIDVVKD